MHFQRTVQQRSGLLPIPLRIHDRQANALQELPQQAVSAPRKERRTQFLEAARTAQAKEEGKEADVQRLH